ncbi:hypothetical protein F3J40_16635 [Pantoea sp. Acro-835]|uniref:Uncharacterized protein n=1 Tax=Candidatus Pantoea multigeneris TaxID=2608357 RepID=A0ABX0RHU1_9GAMM|nr:hypothetical protein [Pantoea multigeneris]
MQLIPVFCTKLSTENVNKIAFFDPSLFITKANSVSYCHVVPLYPLLSSGLPPVRSVKQSSYSNFALR